MNGAAALLEEEWFRRVERIESRPRCVRQPSKPTEQQLSLPEPQVEPKLSTRMQLRLEAAEQRMRERHQKLSARDRHAVVVIVVTPTRHDAGCGGEVPNEPDCLGRLSFTTTGYGRRKRRNFANLGSWIEHLEAMGRKWRMG